MKIKLFGYYLTIKLDKILMGDDEIMNWYKDWFKIPVEEKPKYPKMYLIKMFRKKYNTSLVYAKDRVDNFCKINKIDIKNL